MGFLIAPCTMEHISRSVFECLKGHIFRVSLHRKLMFLGWNLFFFFPEAGHDCPKWEYVVTSFTLSGCCRQEKVQH